METGDKMKEKKKPNVMKLRIREKFAYGGAAVALEAIKNITSMFLMFFYADKIGISPAIVGAALMIGKIWDGISDPLMGYISDHTQAKWGRRRTYLLCGSVPIGILFYFLWAPPAFLTAVPGAGIVVFLFIFYLLVNTGYTVVAVPYYSLGAEISTDPDERSAAFSFNYVGQKIGMLLAILLPNIAFSFYDKIIMGLHTNLGLFSPEKTEALIVYFSNEQNSFRVIGAVLGIIITATILITFKGTKERIAINVEPKVEGFTNTGKRIFGDFFGTLKNQPFRILIIATIVAEVNGGIVLTLLPYVVIYWLKMDALLTVFMLEAVTIGSISAFLWVKLSKKIGKKTVFAITMVMYGVAAWSYLLQGPGLEIRMIFLAALWGASLAGYVMIWSLIADFVDYDELETGYRHEGQFYGVYTLVTKLATALGMFLVGIFLSTIGLEHGVEVTPKMISSLKIFVGPVAGTINFIGVIIFLRMKYDKNAHKEVRAKLEKRRGVLEE
jgi:glycoside/pentoside/hexuronide:cation symporter, GPH family